MSLINSTTFFRRVAQRESIISGSPLQDGEFVVSCSDLPAVYGRQHWTGSASNTLREVVNLIVSSKSEILGGRYDSKFEVSSQLRGFLELLLHQKEQVPEYCVHVFVYLFWDSVRYMNAVVPPVGEVFFTSNTLDGRVDRDHRYYRLLQRLKAVTNVDLISICEDCQHIFLIEMKRSTLDDRAVGQVLRYFNDASKLLVDRVVRDYNLAYIRPVLVLSDATTQYMEAFPSHFREVLDVYQYTTDRKEDGQIEVALHHLRKRFLSSYMT